MNIFQRGLVASLALAASVVLAQTPQLMAAQSEGLGASQADAWQLAVLINQDRAAQGIEPLKWDPALAEAARRHCLRMVAEGAIAHRYDDEPSLSERAAQAGARFSLIEENVAVGPDPAAIEDAWMHSPGHRANLLNPNVNRVGAAVVASHGVLYAVTDYAHAVPALKEEQVEAGIANLMRVSGITVVRGTPAARAACAMSQGVPASASPGLHLGFIMRWQGPELNRLPQALVDKLASGEYREAAVGSCPPEDQQDGFMAYHIAVLLYY
jgi:uncharacterized protein YkwD